jgi:hydroxyacylglutathione hydrolase
VNATLRFFSYTCNEGTDMILKKLTLGPYASNCYIIGDNASKEGMIIDPGAEPQEILLVVEKEKLKIKTIILTHRHPDHVGAAAKVQAAVKAPLASHPECARYLPHSPDYVYEKPFEGAPKPERLLNDGDNINIGSLNFKVLHTPGHTPCGISLYGEGHVFTGDTLFNYGIGRYDLIDGDYHALINGIKTKLLTLPPETVIHPGHGPDSTIATEKRANTFLR